MEDFVVDVHRCGGINGWFWVDLIHSTCTTSAHDINEQCTMAGLAKNAQSGPIIDTVPCWWILQGENGDGWMQSLGNEEKVVYIARNGAN